MDAREPRANGGGGEVLPRPRLNAYQAEGGGGGTTDGRSLHVIVFGSCHDASQGPVVPPPVLPPRSITENSEPAGVKWKMPQLLMPTAPTWRAATFWNVAFPAARALRTDVPVPSTLTSLKLTFFTLYRSSWCQEPEHSHMNSCDLTR